MHVTQRALARTRSPFFLTLGAIGLSAAFVVTCKTPAGASSRDDIGGEQYRALETAPITPADESQKARAGHAIKSVFVIVMENQDWSAVKGSASAPFINGTLLAMGAHAERYSDVGVHPSEPNYVWLEAGSNLGIVNDDAAAYNDRTTTKHLATLLDAVGVRWKSYVEGIGGDICPFEDKGAYASKHVPVLFFDDVWNNCVAHVRPYSELGSDMTAGTVPQYNFITPNLCHDMHDGCTTPDLVKSGDDWLAAEVPKILASRAYKDGGAIFITWDEGTGGDAPIGMIVVSPFAKPGYAGMVPYSHSSTLRTMQEIFAVQPYLRDAANASSLSDLFATFP
jgi:hypothetical protein